VNDASSVSGGGLAAGDHVGPYVVTAPLGRGGMGEVYRARDDRFDRDVAIKILPASFAADPDRLRRFEQEARAAGRLSHPNILTVHDLGRHRGAPYLVMELLEGQTLRERLARGALPQEEAIDRALQIARGLAVAHAEGIVHRDLKPENLFVTRDGRLKILDFGLAKLAPPIPAAPATGSLSAAPTAVARTEAGTVLGTLAYMSPEQARGADADAPTDVFSFGAVFYEMLTGRRAFERATGVDTLAAVLNEEPAELPARVPEDVRRLVRRCLAKTTRDRFAGGGDLLTALETLPRAGGDAGRRPLARVAGGALIAGVAAATAVGLWLRRSLGEAPPVTRLEQVTMSEATETAPSFSPDGTRLLYVVESGGLRHLRLRELSSGADTTVTTGDFDELQPAWSPDGRAALFVRARQARQHLEPGDVLGSYTGGGDVWERELGSGRETRLVENAFNPAVSPDGARIAVDAAWVGPSRIWMVDRQGHNPVQLTSDTTEAVTHVRPRWSPDGARLVFKHIERTRFDVRLVDVATKQVTVLTDDAYPDHDPVFGANGRAIYFSSYRSGGLNIWRMPIDGAGRPAGRAQQLTAGAGQDLEASPAPDGRRMAFAVLRQNASIWKLPIDPASGRVTGEPEQVIATTREDSRGAWSPDGRSIAFNSDRGGAMNIWVYDVASSQARPLTEGPGGDFQPSWSPDGRRLAFFSSRSGSADIWSVDVETRALRQLTRGRAMEINPFWSPDGRSIAYQSDESGRLEVWAMNADGSGPRALTSVGVTGHFLRFTPDGTEVVFRCPAGGAGRTMAVAVAGGEPRALGEVAGGSHMSFAPRGDAIMDVVAHKTLWVSPLRDGGVPEKVYEFPDASVRIDYPVWSPDGRWVLFDRFLPKGGDIWMMQGLDDR
jgi:Tol biopolymer transport system component